MKAARFHILLLLLFNMSTIQAQITRIKGVVTDAETDEPIPFATIRFEGSNRGVVTDFEGKYMLDTDEEFKKLKASAAGYKPSVKTVAPHREQNINFKLAPETKELDEVTVNSGKNRYRNKNNPAVALIRKVIDHKSQNRQDHFNYYEYDKYEKIQFALSNVTEKFRNRKAFKKFQFVFENMDTTKLQGKPVLPVYLKESLSKVYSRKSPSFRKELVSANKTVAFEGYVDNQGVDAYMKYLYQDIDIYDNNVTLLTNQFLSPLAPLSPTFYKFFITDTITDSGNRYIRLFFAPRNKTDLLFQGYLYITTDSNYAVKKVDMTVNKNINLNWVKELKIVQEFEKKDTSGYVLTNDEISADFGLNKGKMGIFGQRTVSYKNIQVDRPRPVAEYTGDEMVVMEEAEMRPDSFWTEHRHMELSTSEKGVYTTIDSIKRVPAFKRTMNLLVLLFAGYKNIGPYFEIGPVSTFYSFNPVEGFRLRAGGRTTNHFSKRFNLEGYGAYGFKDQRWKYYAGTSISLSKRTVYEFPVKAIRINYQYDTKIPGQELQFVQEDNFLLSFKRGINDKWLYNHTFNLEWLNEFRNHFSFSLAYKNWIQEAAGGLHFMTTAESDYTQAVKNIQTSEFSLLLRWAPNEQFYQGKTYRIPISYKNPIFTIRYIRGVKGFLGGQYNYQNLSFNFTKRFFLSQLGYTDVVVEAGKIFGQVPFPLLTIHRANQTYAYQLQSYNLMNFLEFVSDQYASLNVDHCFNGFFFNKIPLLRKLKWREVICVKVLYGSLSDNNNPKYTSGLFLFPVSTNGTPITYTLSQKPYVEGSVAIANIFKFFRIDLVKRFTYTDLPNVSTLAIRGRFKFDF